MHIVLRSLLLIAGLTLLTPQSAAQGKQGKKQKRKKQESNLPDLWSEPQRVAKGEEMLGKVYEAAGGLEKWKAAKGFRFQVLKTRWVVVDTKTGELKVHHYIPRLSWLDQAATGFVISEYASGGNYKPVYRRDVAVGNFAWTETNGSFNRKPEAAIGARMLVRRQHFLATMPFSLDSHGAEMVFVKNLPNDRALYGVHLKKPVVMELIEDVFDYALVIDTKTNRVQQLQYSLVAEDVMTLDKSTECYVDFESGTKVAGLDLPKSYTWFYEVPARHEVFTIVRMEELALPPASIRRPWLSGAVWETDLRADHWDPKGTIKPKESTDQE